MKNYGMPFKNTAIDKMSGKFSNGEPEPKMRVQTTKEVTVSNKPKKKGPVAKMGERETRFRATMMKAAETVFGFGPKDRTPHMQRILNKDAAIYNEKKLAQKKQDVRDAHSAAKYKLKLESLQKNGYSKKGF